jgi:tetratricopeptide (TPR) repeat protein
MRDLQELQQWAAELALTADPHTAIDAIDEVLAHPDLLPRDRAQALYNRAGALSDLGLHQDAIDGYSEALALCDPDAPDSRMFPAICYVSRSRRYEALGRHAEAFADLLVAIETHPRVVRFALRRELDQPLH